jgi:hypothetical protein
LQEIVNRTRGLKELIGKTEGLLAQLEANLQAMINDPVALKKVESGRVVAQEKVRVARQQVQEHTAILEQHGVVWDEDTGVIVEIRNWQPQVHKDDQGGGAGDDGGSGWESGGEGVEEEDGEDGGCAGHDASVEIEAGGSNGTSTRWLVTQGVNRGSSTGEIVSGNGTHVLAGGMDGYGNGSDRVIRTLVQFARHRQQ